MIIEPITKKYLIALRTITQITNIRNYEEITKSY